MEQKFENVLEQKPEKQSEIILHFFRHSKKASGYEDDYKAPLSSEGVELVSQKSENYKSDIPENQKMAWGSPRVRSQETALGISQIETNNHIPVGSRLGVDERLNFHFDFEDNNEFAEVMNTSFSDGTYLKKLVEESDSLAEKVEDEHNSTYSKLARNIASFIQRYIKASNRWNTLVNDKNKNYDPRLERFIGTHQGVVEVFVAKLLEMKYGKDKRDEFVKSLNDTGFDLIEGVDIKVIQDNGGVKVSLESGPGSSFILSEILDNEDLEKIMN